ncbi:MAG: GspE/PulE family protein [Gemmataceae bacterium]|nr:GspE/PulE family protein [Gemmataceae bacterium]
MVETFNLIQLWATPFPRGEGFYFHLYALGFFIAIYASWIHLSSWVDDDVDTVGLDAKFWNIVVISGAIVGGLVFWSCPKPILSFASLILGAFAPIGVYIYFRNLEVPEEGKLFTPTHFRFLAEKYLKMRFDSEGAKESKNIPIRFIGKSEDKNKPGGDSKISRVEDSEYYQVALEVIYEAFQMRATDVHLEPGKEEMSVRFRIDGIMNQREPLTRQTGDAMVNILKVLANLDISEKRKPQDGSFSAEVLDQPDDDQDAPKKKSKKPTILDFRVATAGSVAGEKMVLRILDGSKSMGSLKKLGMRDKLKDQIEAIVNQPHGMLIVCGPTGAGKSTTLYACLSEIDRFQKNVITLENPVEYQIENVTQIEINPKAGKTFASELRSILRQDPDVIYVGEIRDKETAEISCQAAQTGHMVFTTVHANDSVTAFGRLLDLGVAPFMIANSVSAILSQRLVRILCPKCKVKYRPNPEILKKFNLSPDKHEFFYKAKSEVNQEEKDDSPLCKNCGGTGFRGRSGVYELLVLNETIKNLIRDNPSVGAIREEAVRTGMKYLQEDGLRQVVAGNTSIQEILRVCK